MAVLDPFSTPPSPVLLGFDMSASIVSGVHRALEQSKQPLPAEHTTAIQGVRFQFARHVPVLVLTLRLNQVCAL